MHYNTVLVPMMGALWNRCISALLSTTWLYKNLPLPFEGRGAHLSHAERNQAATIFTNFTYHIYYKWTECILLTIFITNGLSVFYLPYLLQMD